MIEIGAARPEELDTVARLLSEAFEFPFSAARDAFYEAPYSKLENKRVLRVDGQIVSCLTIVPADCWLGLGIARVAGIAGVATWKAFRRQGYAARLLQETLPLLRRKGYALSALQPFSMDYYRRLGYVLTATATRHFFPAARLSREGAIEKVRPVRSEDIPALRRLYETVAVGNPLRCRRDTKRWEYILRHARQSLVYAPNHRAQGYLLYDYLPARIQRLSPYSTALPTIRILEWNAPTVGARAAFTAYLAAQPNIGRIVLEVPTDYDPTTALMLAGSPSDVSTVREPLLMARLLNFPEAIAARLAQQNYAGGKLLLQYREVNSQEACAVRVSASPEGAAQVDRAQPSEAGAYSERVEASGDAWTQLLTGYLGIEEFLKARGVQAQGQFAADWLARLFSPMPAPFLPNLDRF